jgi:lysophospholipase L1-like esterase
MKKLLLHLLLALPCFASPEIILNSFGQKTLELENDNGNPGYFAVQSSRDLTNWQTLVFTTNSSAKTHVSVPRPITASRLFLRTIETNAPTATGFETQASGLALSVGSGTLYDDVGKPIGFNGGSVALFPSYTNYVVLNLGTGLLYPLSRAIDSGSVLIAKVITGTTNVVSIEKPTIKIPFGGIEYAKSLIALKFHSLNIHLYGDSLTGGSGSGTMWWDLLFKSQYATNGFNIFSPDRVVTRNYAFGGTVAEYTLSILGSDDNLRSPPDLVTIEVGVNQSRYAEVATEDIVRQLRANDIDVLLISGNANQGFPGVHEDLGLNMYKLAQKYRCAVADTWAYVNYVNLTGTNTWFDSVHQNQAGWNAWATAILGVLNTYTQNAVIPDSSANRVLVHPIVAERDRLFDTATFSPPSGFTGAHFSTNVVLPTNAIPFLYGQTVSNAVVYVPTNGVVTFNNPNWVGCSLLLERGGGQGSFSGYWEVIGCDGTSNLKKPVTFTDPNFGAGALVVSAADITIADTAPLLFLQDGCQGLTPSGINSSVRLTVTNGTAHVLGVTFYIPKN